MQIIWIVVFFGIITGSICKKVHHPPRLQWFLTEKPHSETGTEDRPVCVTQQCEELANALVKSMNRSVDPCEDFYEYACGNWPKHNPLPKDEVIWNLFIKSQRKVEDRLKEIIEEGPKPDDYHAAKIAKRAFKACLDTDMMEKEGIQPLISLMWRAGGWPLIMEEDEWDEETTTWHSVDDYYARLIGLNSFHDLNTEMDFRDRDHISLMISYPHTPPDMYKIFNSDEIYADSSDENNESGEGSQERGSEERKDYEDDNETNEVDDEDEYKLRKRKMSKKRINNRVTHKNRMNNRIKVTKEHGGKRKLKKRTKRNAIKVNAHNTRQRKQRIANRRIGHVTRKATKKSSKYILVSEPDSIKKSTKINELRNVKETGNMNESNDLYFEDAGNEDRNNTEIEVEKQGEGSTDENNEKNDYSGNGEDYSGSGNHEWDDEDYSGSGGYEWDYEDYSGSGDYEWDDEDGSGNGDDDDEDGSGSGDDDDETDDDRDSKERGEEQRELARKMQIKYANYMLNVSIALSEARGVPIPREKLVRDIDDLIQFQLKMLEYSYMFGKRLNITLGSFQKTYDSLKPKTCNGKVNWIKKVQDLLLSGGMEVHRDTVVVIASFNYMKVLCELLDTTPSRTLVNYIHWNFLSRALKATTKEMRKMYYNWSGKQMEDTKRTQVCVEEIKAEYILGYEYVKRYFSDKTLQTASDMIDDIQKEVEYEIKKSPWMNDKIKHIILDKLIYMEKVIGYPNSYRNTTIMKKYLKGLSATKSHFDNTLSIMRYIKLKKLKIIFTKELPQDVDINPLIVNAFFSAFQNLIEITAADFQTPLFDPNQPWYTNYGIIGLVMSHEVNHGFDNAGHLYNKDGELIEWPPKMSVEYEKRAQCFLDQFTNYSIVLNKTANIHIKNYGERTIGENIADTMGLNAVFKAYQRRLRKCEKPDPMLPGLENLSNEQLFFLSFAHIWCEVANPEQIRSSLKYDSHSLGPLRVIGSVSNSKDFAKAYNCPSGSPMNPEKKCSIWK